VTAGIAREELELLADTIGTFPTSIDIDLRFNTDPLPVLVSRFARGREQAAGVRAALAAAAEAASPALRLLRTQQSLVASQERLAELRGLTGEDKATAEGLASAVLDVAGAQVELNSATVGVSGVLNESRDAFIEAGVTAGIAREELELLADTIGTFPTSIDIDLRFNTDPLPVLVSRFARGREHGGPVTRGEPVLVGERGPEIFFPNSPGVISPSAAGGTINVTVNQPQTLDFATDLAAGLIAANVTRQVEAIR